MICLRCGYCCKKLVAVIVVDPDKADREGIQEDNLTTITDEIDCPHLRGDKPGEYSCAIHDRSWYKDTPCAQYQSHFPENKCRMGKFLLHREEG